MATQQLIIQPPYTFCRNPMTLGTIMMYLGVVLLFNSPGAARLVLLSAAGLTEKQTAWLHAKAG